MKKHILLLPLFVLATLPVCTLASIGDSLHAIHYTLYINEINTDDQTIDAEASITLKPKINDLDKICLQLLDLTTTSVILDGTVTTNYTHENGVIHIPLDEPADTNDILEIHIAYHGEPFHESWGGFHFSGDYAFNLGVGISNIPHNLGKAWFPCIDDFTDRATYELFVTVDEGLTAVCGGILVEVTSPQPGKQTYHWTLNQPVPTYLASVAIGEYTLIEDVYYGSQDEIPIDYYVRPSDSAKVEDNFENLKNITAIFENHFGPYSWDRIGYVGTAIGAMEHATNIAYPNSTITGGSTYEWLYAHELSHMWFGDKVTCNCAEEMWLNEGWAVFCELFYTEVLYDQEMFKTSLMDKHAEVLRYAHAEENGYWPLNQLPQQYTYGTSAYDKGATVVQTLRNYLGDDLFFETMAAYLDTFAFTSVSSYDMRDFITGHTGINMDGFFDNWVFHGGTPHYSLDSFNIQPTGTGSDVTLYLKQKRKGPSFTGQMNKTDVCFLDAGWNLTMDTVWFSGETGTSIKSLSYEPLAVFLDLGQNICDATTDDQQVIHSTGEYDFDRTFFHMEVAEMSDSAFVRVTHHWAPPDSLLEPVPDLRISDYRYWSVKGIFPDNFTATGRFYYSKTGNLDNTLILSETDSVVILHRPGPGHEWEVIPTTQLGPWSIGYLYVEDMPPGEYTLGVFDLSVGIPDENPGEAPVKTIHVFPNPSSDHFNILIEKARKGEIIIRDSGGREVERLITKSGQHAYHWYPEHIPAGPYFLTLRGNDGRVIHTEKILIRE